MHKLHRILVVVDRGKQPLEDVRKALELARRCGAHIELFLCEAEQAYVLDHRYDREAVERARAECVAQALAYLRELRALVGAGAVEIAVAAQCESPLCESIVRKVLRSRSDLVIKRASGVDPGGYGCPDPNDWELMRTCPATLMLTRGRTWQVHPRFLAAVDVSAGETAGLPERVLDYAQTLAGAWHAGLDVIYGEAPDSKSAREHSEQLRTLCDSHAIAPDCTHVLSGEPDLTLPAFVGRQPCDVMILGALTHRAGTSALVGTLTSRLLEALDCDFVLVKRPRHAAPLGRARHDTACARSVRS
jgi:universal stress protein E